ncbi:TetR/AcrR family transcriptional regulator [Lutimonas sp.]|uniref:TetR/AcrR family transcriptional regulator n=1 Tax=Lutimonas sp. TaxID=1872403 RepID=UPI003D9BD949
MNKMSLSQGRVNQKNKTRTKILDAAKELMSGSKKLTLEEVAHQARIGRATIYRYFPNVELLITEASLDIHFLSSEELFEKVKHLPIPERIKYIQDYYNELAQKHEVIFRRYLSAALLESIATGNKIRGARRLETMSLVLSSAKGLVSEKDLENLKNIGTILMGIESLIVAKDVCDLTNEQLNKTLNWAIDMILKGMADGGEDFV